MRASKNDPRPILAITPYICEKVIFRQSDTVDRSVIRNDAGRSGHAYGYGPKVLHRRLEISRR